MALAWPVIVGGDCAAPAPAGARRRNEQMATTATVDETKLNDFMGKMVNDLGAAANAPPGPAW